MSEVKTLDIGAKFSHATVGILRNFDGKLFIKEAVGATSCEISFGTLPNGATVPFFHSHYDNEECYIILSGAGRFQIDNEVFDISEGSVIRVATGCDRNLKCLSTEPMCYICIQAKEDSLENYSMADVKVSERTSLL